MERNSKGKNFFLKTLAGILGIAVVFYFAGGPHYYRYFQLKSSPDRNSFEYFFFKYPNSQYKTKVMEMYDDFYFNDGKDYWIKQNNSAAVIHYLEKFPNARHKSEAMTIYENCWYEDFRQKPDVEKAQAFFTLFPNSKYRETVRATKDKLWKSMEDRYSAKVSHANTGHAGVSFMRAVMDYMKQKGRPVVFMEVKQETNLTEWDELSDKQRQVLNTLCRLTFDDVEEEFLPLESPPPSVKSDYMPHVANSIASDVQDVIEKNINSTFGKDFIRLAFVKPPYTYAEQKDSVKKGDIIATIQYTVSNSYLPGGLPSLYYISPDEITSVLNPRTDINTKFIMAVKVDWLINISIPGTDIVYKAKFTTDGIDRFVCTSDPYVKLNEEYAKQFAEKVCEDLGLKEIE